LAFDKYGGEGGIRTPDTFSGMPVFKTGAINHSATSPTTTALLLQFYYSQWIFNWRGSELVFVLKALSVVSSSAQRFDLANLCSLGEVALHFKDIFRFLMYG
jgi:hypothetical protein